jgi:hypothetical protein
MHRSSAKKEKGNKSPVRPSPARSSEEQFKAVRRDISAESVIAA